MTEEEAKKKWCPFGRQPYDTGSHVKAADQQYVTANRPGPSENGWTLCIGSNCMAWRVRLWQGDPTGHGFCGLAGKDGS